MTEEDHTAPAAWDDGAEDQESKPRRTTRASDDDGPRGTAGDDDDGADGAMSDKPRRTQRASDDDGPPRTPDDDHASVADPEVFYAPRRSKGPPHHRGPQEREGGDDAPPRRPRKEWVASLEWDAPSISADRRRDLGPGYDRRRLRRLIAGIILLAVLLLLPTPRDLTVDAYRSLVLFIFLVFLWVTEALPLPVTALLAGVGLLLLGIKDEPNEAFEPYAQDTFFFILGSLILADGIAKSGADEILAQRILRVFGHNTHTLLFGIVASTSILAMFVSDHAIAAIMLPIVLGLIRHESLRGIRNVAPAFLLAIAFGANIAGLATPSGGSRNAIALGYLRDLYGVQISYLDWVERAAPISLALIPFVYLVLAISFRVPFTRIKALPFAEGPAQRLSPRQWAALIVLGLTVAGWILVSETYGLGAIAIVGAVLMFVVGVLDWEDTRSTIPWGVAFVYGAALVMGRVLTETGAAGWLADHAFLYLPVHEPIALVIIVVIVTVVLTNVMSDGATVAVLAPVTLSLALLAAYSVADMGMLTALSSAFAFVLVIGTPPNLIVYASGRLKPSDFLRAGIPMTIIGIAAVLFAAFRYWPTLS